MKNVKSLLIELDRLKGVYRKSYIASEERRENSAEHSWHLAMAIIALKPFFPDHLNVDHAMRLALLHDVCEIGAGDSCAYSRDDVQVAEHELEYLATLSACYSSFGNEVIDLWNEYDKQETIESQWVRVADKVVPFILNMANSGRTWREQGITEGMVRTHHAFIESVSPAIHGWMMAELKIAVDAGWLGTDSSLPPQCPSKTGNASKT